MKESERDESEEIERVTREMQEMILADLRRTYSAVVIDHWQHPRNFSTLEAPDGYARMTGICGDTMEIYLKIRDEKVAACTFQTDGCGTTIVCGSVATELASGKTIIETLGAVSAEGILRILGGLPESSVHCAQLASETLRRALADYLSKKNTLWKKNYQKK